MQDFVICSMNVSCTWIFHFNLRSQNEWFDHLRFCNERDGIFEPLGQTYWFLKIENSISGSSTHRPIWIIRNSEERSGEKERKKTATVLWLNRRFQMYCCFSPSFSSRYRYIFQLLLVCCFYNYYFFIPIRHKFYEASHFQKAYLACVNSNKCKKNVVCAWFVRSFVQSRCCWFFPCSQFSSVRFGSIHF